MNPEERRSADKKLEEQANRLLYKVLDPNRSSKDVARFTKELREFANEHGFIAKAQKAATPSRHRRR